MRRFVDILFSLSAIIITSPIWIIISVAIKSTSSGPVLFVQQRVGAGQRLFGLLKFRSMYNAPQGLELTVGEDMRITPVGRVMRRLKLDELPQFVNVLAGHMTLVGPRPEIPRFVAAYQPWMMEALRLKPGMTDPASIAFRNEPSILAKSENPEREYIETILPQKIRMSLDYQSARSPLTDIVLLIRTALLLFGR